MKGRGRAVVVGGGVAGLTWALAAAEAGFDVTLLEAGSVLGGVVRSERLGPVTVDVGAESFALTRPDVVRLADHLGLADEVVRPAVHQAHVVSGGRRLPLPPGILGIPAEPADIAALLGPEVAAEALRRDAMPVPADAPSTIGRLVRERLGDAVADVLVDPVLAGVHATGADDAELASVAPSLHAAMLDHGGLMPAVRALRGPLGPTGSAVASIVGGMGRLVERLHERLDAHGVEVRTGSEARALRLDGRWHVRTDAGELTADVLCLAVPARIASTLLAEVASSDHASLARAVASGLDALPTTHPVTLVTLLLEDALLGRAGAPVGSGVLVADGTVRAKALTHASAKWGWLAERLPADHHVVRLSYGGTHATDLENGTDAAAAVALADSLVLLEGALGAPVVRAALVTRWSGVLSRPVVGRAAGIAGIDELLDGLPHLALVGSALAGNGLAGVVGRSHREATRTL